MIRKRVGDAFWLIRQPDHARLAGTIARAIGNRQFARPGRPDTVYAAVDAHDDGWRSHDDAPTLDDDGLPAHVLDMPRPVEHAAWLASAETATAIDPYAGLLVSLHQLTLSARSASAGPADRFDDEHRRRQFDLNKVQHALIEHAEALRHSLGLPTDRPLRLGLADGWGTPAEEQLKFDLRLLQAADAIALHLCGDHVPASIVPQPHPRVGAGQATLCLTPVPRGLAVRPWPFGEPIVRLSVPCRSVPAIEFRSVQQFRAAVSDAALMRIEVELHAT